jgi:hypothetical protein
MALKFRYKSKEEVPAEALPLYTERDGAFVLDVDGAVDKARVDEVRAGNVALANQLAEQRKRFEAIESEQVKTIAAERDSLNARRKFYRRDAEQRKETQRRQKNRGKNQQKVTEETKNRWEDRGLGSEKVISDPHEQDNANKYDYPINGGPPELAVFGFFVLWVHSQFVGGKMANHKFEFRTNNTAERRI